MRGVVKVEIHGNWQPKFAHVVDAFAQNFNDKQDIGAALTVFWRGENVLDIWAGEKNYKTHTAWSENTLVPVFSVTKALAALAFLILATRGKFDYDAPVARYWPDFALVGKKTITCRELLEHRAGLYALDVQLDLADFRDNPTKVERALTHQKPHFLPGSAQAYGAQVWGAYAGALFKCVAHETIGTFFQREVAAKLKVDCFIGLPAAYDDRLATLYPVSAFDRIAALVPDLIGGNTTEGRIARAFVAGDRSIERAYTNPALGPKSLDVFNETWVHRLELPWAGAITNARALATIMNVFAMGGKIGKIKFADRALMHELTRANPLRYDLVLQKRLGWNLGFLKEEVHIYSPHSEAFGHSGMGGPVALTDPKVGLAFAYVANKMDYKIRPDKTLRLSKAIYDSL